MSIILKNKILKELDAIPFSNETENDNDDRVYTAIVSALIDYVNNDIAPITGVLVGVDATVPTPTPVFGNSTHNLLTVTSTWENTFKSSIKTGVDVGATLRMFTALQTMITGTINISLETAIPITVIAPPPEPVIASPVIFPSMASFGTPCQTELLATKGDRNTSWGIVAKYIQMGLNINMSPPIMVSGTLLAVVTGVATPSPVSFL